MVREDIIPASLLARSIWRPSPDSGQCLQPLDKGLATIAKHFARLMVADMMREKFEQIPHFIDKCTQKTVFFLWRHANDIHYSHHFLSFPEEQQTYLATSL